MTKNSLLRILLLAVAAFILSACGGRFANTSWPGLTAGEDTVYVAFDQHVYALQADNGSERWRFPEEADNSQNFYAPPTLVENGELVAGAYNNFLFGIDAATGNQDWSYEEAGKAYIGAADLAGELVVVPNADNTLRALQVNGSSVSLRWDFGSDEGFWVQPLVNGELVYVPAMDKTLHALNAENGQEVWSFDLGHAALGRPATDENGLLFIGTVGSRVIAVDADRGTQVWSVDTDDWVWGSVVYADEIVYAADLSGVVYAFEAANGRELWRRDVGGSITGAPLVLGDSVYVGTEDGEVVALDMEGDISWEEDVDGKLLSDPVAVGEDLIVFGALEAEEVVYAYDIAGSLQWSFSPDN